jgi:hypothetical protein
MIMTGENPKYSVEKFLNQKRDFEVSKMFGFGWLRKLSWKYFTV